MLTSLVVVAVIAQSKQVTIDIKIAPAKVVLQKLGEELDVRMIPGGSVSQDVFGISFHEASSATVLAEIATTLNAQWERDSSGTYILNRTAKHEAAEDQESRLALMNSIKADLAKTKNAAQFDRDVILKILNSGKRLATGTASFVTTEKLNELNGQMPPARLLQSVLEAIGPDELLRPWKPGGVDYTVNPSPSQKSLSPGLQPIFRRFEAETRLHAELIDSVGAPPSNHYHDLFHAQFGQSTGPLKYTLQTEIINETQLRVRLLIESPTGEMGAADRYFVLQRDGEPLSYADLGQGLTNPIPLSDTEKELLQSQRATPNPALRRVIENLATKDLLRYLVEAPYVEFAKAKSLNAVYLLYDSAWHISYNEYPRDGQSIETFFAGPKLPYQYNIEIENNTLRVRPINRRSARENRFPRAEMPRALATFLRLQYADLNALADLAAATQTNNTLNSVAHLLNMASGIRSDSVLAQPCAPEVLRFFGRLSAQERAKAQNGGVIVPMPFASEALDSQVITLLYGFGRLTAEFHELDGIPVPFGMMTQADADLEQNMSTVLANGYPQGSFVRVQLNVLPRLFYRKEGGHREQISMTSPQSIGRQLSSGRLDGPIQYAMAASGELVLDIDLQKRGKKRFVVYQRNTPTPLKMGPLESLPAEIQELIRGAMKKPTLLR